MSELLRGWVPPLTSKRREEVRPEATNDDEGDAPMEEKAVRMYHDNNNMRGCGIAHQKCGGGVRIIRKRIGNT